MTRTSSAASITILLLALIAALTVNFAQAQALRPLTQSLLKSLTELDTATGQAIKAAQSIKLEDLKLSNQDRRFIDDSRARTIKSGELVHKQVDLFRRRQTLQDLFALKSVLDGFERQLDSLGARAHCVELRQDGDASAKAANWLMAIERSADAVDAAAVAFDVEALDLLAKADRALSTFRGGQ